jgi:transposase
MKKSTSNQQTVIGIDLGDIKHAVCVTDKHGKILQEFSIPNRRDCLEDLAEDYPCSRIAMEVGTHSPWISRLLTAKGAEVFVANARRLRAIYTNPRKCDRLDAQMLAKLVRVDPELLAPIRHRSEEAQQDLLAIKLRDTLVRQRVNIISSIRSSLKALGFRLPSPSTTCFAKAARKFLVEEPQLLSSIAPCLQVLDELSERIREFDRSISKATKDSYPEAGPLQEIGGIGPITALSFVLVIEDPSRFPEARDVGAYLGLVPRRDQSGGTDKELPISKAGNRYLRCLLVQSAQYILGHFGPDCELRRYGLRLAARGGKAAKKKAVVAVARKLAVLMLTLWQNQSAYEPLRNTERKAA